MIPELGIVVPPLVRFLEVLPSRIVSASQFRQHRVGGAPKYMQLFRVLSSELLTPTLNLPLVLKEYYVFN